MSITIMHRSCTLCGRQYTYNPSVGRFGRVCPHCGKVQERLIGGCESEGDDRALRPTIMPK